MISTWVLKWKCSWGVLKGKDLPSTRILSHGWSWRRFGKCDIFPLLGEMSNEPLVIRIHFNWIKTCHHGGWVTFSPECGEWSSIGFLSILGRFQCYWARCASELSERCSNLQHFLPWIQSCPTWSVHRAWPSCVPSAIYFLHTTFQERSSELLFMSLKCQRRKCIDQCPIL